jgi:hypothetical protein
MASDQPLRGTMQGHTRESKDVALDSAAGVEHPFDQKVFRVSQSLLPAPSAFRSAHTPEGESRWQQEP